MRLVRSVVIVIMALWVLGNLGSALSAVFGEDGIVIGLMIFIGVTAGVVVVSRWARLVHPWVWWPVFGAGLALLRMAVSWRATCEGTDLSIPAKRLSQYAVVGGSRRGGGLLVKGEPMKLIAPRRVRLRVTRCAVVVTVRLHPGQTPEDWDRACEAFAHQWRVHRVRSVSERPGFVTLTGLGFDPLRFPPRPKPQDPPTAAGPMVAAGPDGPRPQRTDVAVSSDVLVSVVGVHEDGQPWVIDMTKRPHYLVTGATRSGKSTLTVRLLSQLCTRPVALVGIDCKGGMELAPFGPRLSALATTKGEAAAALDSVVGLLTLRTMQCREFGARSIWELPVEIRPEPIVVVVDEIAELFLFADKAGKEESGQCVLGLIRIGQLGAALGIHLWVAGQRFGSDLGQGATLVRAQLAGRICHRVADQETAAMTLAGLPNESLVEALAIATDLAGVAVVGDDGGTWGLARSFGTSMIEATVIAREFAGLKVELPEITAAISRVRVGGVGGGDY